MVLLRVTRATKSESYRCPDLLAEGFFGNNLSSHCILHCPTEQGRPTVECEIVDTAIRIDFSLERAVPSTCEALLIGPVKSIRPLPVWVCNGVHVDASTDGSLVWRFVFPERVYLKVSTICVPRHRCISREPRSKLQSITVHSNTCTTWPDERLTRITTAPL
jgi:hypothetical protein